MKKWIKLRKKMCVNRLATAASWEKGGKVWKNPGELDNKH